MQKLNVEWNASSCWVVSARSWSLRAAAIASSSDVSSLITQFFIPFERVLIAPMRRVFRGAADSNVYRVPQRSQKDSVRISGIMPPDGFAMDVSARNGPPERGESIPQALTGSSVAGTAPSGTIVRALADRSLRPGPCPRSSRSRNIRRRRPHPAIAGPSARLGRVMGALAAVERFLERLFERQTARLFRTAIRPVQVQRRLERQMESNRTRDGSRTIVPHGFVVRIHPDELRALLGSSPDLAADLADGALGFARSHGYTLLERPVVTL